MPQKKEVTFIRGLDVQGNLTKINRADLAYTLGNFGRFTYTKDLSVKEGMQVKELKDAIINEMKIFFQVSAGKARMMYISLNQGADFMDKLGDDEATLTLGTDAAITMTCLNSLGYAFLQLTSYGKSMKTAIISQWKFVKA